MTVQWLLGWRAALVAGTSAVTAACAVALARAPESNPPAAIRTPIAGTLHTVRDTIIDAAFDAGGIAAAIQQATLSTRLMGAVTTVHVREGDRVAAGQLLLRIDARDLTAKSAQLAATVAEATAMHNDALVHANRIRALYVDSAATRVQLDAAETALARTRAGLDAAHAAAVELGAVRSYALVRAPFGGIVTKRFVDSGAFATPGAPLVTIQDVSTLRVSASTTPSIARGLRRGQMLSALIEGTPVPATIEGIVPSTTKNLYTINALVTNENDAFLAGSKASLRLPMGQRRALTVPASAIARVGDLTGVTLYSANGEDRRWVRLGRTLGGAVEVTAGLQADDRIVVPASPTVSQGGR